MLDQQVLLFGLPIKLNEKVTLYQPTLNEIFEKGILLEKIIEPFIALDKGRFEQESENNKICNFDILFVQIIIGYMQFLTEEKKNTSITEWIKSEKSDWLIIKRLIEILKFLFRTNDVMLIISDGEKVLEDLENNYILVNKSYKIDRNTFEDLKSLVCEVLDVDIDISKEAPIKKSKEEEELDRLFEERKKAYEKKYKKKRQRDKNKDNLTIFTLINYIIHYEYTQYNYNNIKELTIYQIKNTFKYYHGQEMYDIDMKYRTSGNFKMDKKSTDHWFFDK